MACSVKRAACSRAGKGAVAGCAAEARAAYRLRKQFNDTARLWGQ